MKNNTTNKKIFFAFPSFIFWGTLISLIFFSIPPSIIAFVFWQTDLQEGVKILLYVMLVFIFEMFGLSWLLFTDVCTRIVIQDGKIFQKKGWKIIDSFLIEEMVYAEKTFFDKIQGNILCVYYIRKTTDEKELKQLEYGSYIKYEGYIKMEYTKKREKLFDDLRSEELKSIK